MWSSAAWHLNKRPCRHLTHQLSTLSSGPSRCEWPSVQAFGGLRRGVQGLHRFDELQGTWSSLSNELSCLTRLSRPCRSASLPHWPRPGRRPKGSENTFSRLPRSPHVDAAAASSRSLIAAHAESNLGGKYRFLPTDLGRGQSLGLRGLKSHGAQLRNQALSPKTCFLTRRALSLSPKSPPSQVEASDSFFSSLNPKPLNP